MEKFKVAVVGATGMVGRKMLQVLAERKFPVGELYPFASAKSAGSKIVWEGKEYTVLETNEENIKKVGAPDRHHERGRQGQRHILPHVRGGGRHRHR